MREGCRTGDPGRERVHGAGCQRGDASAGAYLAPEVSYRAGRMPGSRSQGFCVSRRAGPGSLTRGKRWGGGGPTHVCWTPAVPVGAELM
jgi:hypothetical protein